MNDFISTDIFNNNSFERVSLNDFNKMWLQRLLQ